MLYRTLAVASMICVGLNSSVSAEEALATISTPNETCFESDPIASLSGSVGDPDHVIWPIVKASSDRNWWVQPKADILASQWIATIYLGERGKHYTSYTVTILVNPSKNITQGKYGANLPPAEYVAPFITVRKARTDDC